MDAAKPFTHRLRPPLTSIIADSIIPGLQLVLNLFVVLVVVGLFIEVTQRFFPVGHEDARMVYEVYSKWIGEMNANQVGMLNSNMPTAKPPERPQSKGRLRKVV